MKKFISTFVLFLCTFLAACGSEEPVVETDIKINMESNEETKELLIDTATISGISSEAEEFLFFDREAQQGFFKFLGMQYYQGEPVQLWMEILDAEGNAKPEGGFTYHNDAEGSEIIDEVTANIYLYRTDQSRELLVENLPANDPHKPLCDWYQEEEAFSVNRICDYTTNFSRWYVDQDKNCYCWWSSIEGTDGEYTFLKMDAAGNILFEVLLDKYVHISNIIEFPDGATYAVIKDGVQNTIRIVEFNHDTGEMSEEDISVQNPSGQPYSSNMSIYFGVSEDGTVYVLMWNGVYRLNLDDGTLSEILSFAGTTYTLGGSIIEQPESVWILAAMCGSEDGSTVILWYNPFHVDVGASGIEERIFPIEENKSVVTIRGYAFSPWLKRQAARFSSTSDTWQIVLEEFASSNAVDSEEYARLTSVQIATGGGPDMLYGDFMEDYIYGMTEKGALADLAPLLAESGIRQEDYLPLVFDVWRDNEHVYGITPQIDSSYLYTIDASALEGTREPDIEALADALLAWGEDAAFDAYIKPESVLRWFLQGSDTLWGMIDREGGSCDFSGELFAKLLDTAKRYGNANARSYHNLVRVTSLNDFYRYDSQAELAAAGRTVCGILFDDGCHGTVTSGYTLAVNASSKSQEGALEFLCFLLDDSSQKQASSFPVKKSLLAAWVEEQSERVIGSEDGITVNSHTYIDYGEQIKESKTYTAADITQERIAEYIAALENIRALPYRNAPLLEIICEEAAAYFNGTKSAADTAKVIENRVQLYLDEGH